MNSTPFEGPGDGSKSEPIILDNGTAKVKIYVGENAVGDKKYPQYTVVYKIGAQRFRRRFADLAVAQREADLALIKLTNQEGRVMELTGSDRDSYVDATELLSELTKDKSTGKPPRLNIVIGEYVQAVKVLPSGVTLADATAFYLARNPRCYQRCTVRKVVDELVARKTRDGWSDVHLKDLRIRLGRFADSFPMDIDKVKGEAIQSFLDELGLGARTRHNFFGHVKALFRFAVRQRYLSRDSLEELDVVELPDKGGGEIEIFTPTELREILEAARPELIPWLTIGAFAGLRHAELQRLRWADVRLQERHVEVTAGNAKTAARRTVPILDNLLEWLTPYAPKGLSDKSVSMFETMNNEISSTVVAINKARRQSAEKAGQDIDAVPKFVWKHNGLRHSFVSYRIAAISDAAQVALECGNSPTMVFRHYRKLVTKTEAEKWFAVSPAAADNIVSMSQSGGA